MIDLPYTVFVELPIYRNKQGQLFCDSLWAKDLRLHLTYISHFSLCCPVIKDKIPQGYESITQENIDDIGIKQVFELRYCVGFMSTFINFFPNFFTVWQAAKYSKIVHSAGSGWPFPSTFYLVFLWPFMHFKWVVNIESSFWMLSRSSKVTPRAWLSHHAHKILLGIALKMADARIFTQTFYQQYFLGQDNSRSMINAASWVDAEKIISKESLIQNQAQKSNTHLKLIFPTRLIADKGVHVLIEAVERLKKMNTKVELTIMGSGDLQPLCKQTCTTVHPTVKLKFLEALPYDSIFFNTLQMYDLIVVANLKEEQPRNIFDAFSQGLGAIASQTKGVQDITSSSNTVYFDVGNAESLANIINELSVNKAKVHELGLAALTSMLQTTHANMHETRRIFLEKTLAL